MPGKNSYFSTPVIFISPDPSKIPLPIFEEDKNTFVNIEKTKFILSILKK